MAAPFLTHLHLFPALLSFPPSSLALWKQAWAADVGVSASGDPFPGMHA